MFKLSFLCIGGRYSSLYFCFELVALTVAGAMCVVRNVTVAALCIISAAVARTISVILMLLEVQCVCLAVFHVPHNQ